VANTQTGSEHHGEIALKTSLRDIDWVECKICSKRASTLGKHLTQVHHLTQKEYLEKFPESLITCISSKEKFKARGQNFAWLKRAKERGNDLLEYKKKMGEAVRQSILKNPEERKRRSNQMADNNRSPEAREKSSITAKKTSSRPEILKKRTKQLANWRKKNPDVFYEKCTSKMHEVWHSKPELILFSFLKNLEGYDFRHNQVIKSDLFLNQSRRKQIDIADKGSRIYIEFDGVYHFLPIKGQETLEKCQQADTLLEQHIMKHNWKLIRISYDQFSYKDGGKFFDECIQKLFEALKNPSSGVYKIGNAYKKTSL